MRTAANADNWLVPGQRSLLSEGASEKSAPLVPSAPLPDYQQNPTPAEASVVVSSNSRRPVVPKQTTGAFGQLLIGSIEVHPERAKWYPPPPIHPGKEVSFSTHRYWMEATEETFDIDSPEDQSVGEINGMFRLGETKVKAMNRAGTTSYYQVYDREHNRVILLNQKLPDVPGITYSTMIRGRPFPPVRFFNHFLNKHSVKKGSKRQELPLRERTTWIYFTPVAKETHLALAPLAPPDGSSLPPSRITDGYDKHLRTFDQYWPPLYMSAEDEESDDDISEGPAERPNSPSAVPLPVYPEPAIREEAMEVIEPIGSSAGESDSAMMDGTTGSSESQPVGNQRSESTVNIGAGSFESELATLNSLRIAETGPTPLTRLAASTSSTPLSNQEEAMIVDVADSPEATPAYSESSSNAFHWIIIQGVPEDLPISLIHDNLSLFAQGRPYVTPMFIGTAGLEVDPVRYIWLENAAAAHKALPAWHGVTVDGQLWLAFTYNGNGPEEAQRVHPRPNRFPVNQSAQVISNGPIQNLRLRIHESSSADAAATIGPLSNFISGAFEVTGRHGSYAAVRVTKTRPSAPLRSNFRGRNKGKGVDRRQGNQGWIPTPNEWTTTWGDSATEGWT